MTGYTKQTDKWRDGQRERSRGWERETAVVSLSFSHKIKNVQTKKGSARRISNSISVTLRYTAAATRRSNNNNNHSNNNHSNNNSCPNNKNSGNTCASRATRKDLQLATVPPSPSPPTQKKQSNLGSNCKRVSGLFFLPLLFGFFCLLLACSSALSFWCSLVWGYLVLGFGAAKNCQAMWSRRRRMSRS